MNLCNSDVIILTAKLENLFSEKIWIYSRHDQVLISWLAQEPIDKHRRAGEVVDSPCLSFINTKPGEKQAMFKNTPKRTEMEPYKTPKK